MSDESAEDADFVPPFTPWLSGPDGKPLKFVPMSLRAILGDRDEDDNEGDT